MRISRFAGNKCDLEDQRKVEKVETEALCEYLPEVLHVTETSAKDNTNIDSIFFYLASELKVNLSFYYIILLQIKYTIFFYLFVDESHF